MTSFLSIGAASFIGALLGSIIGIALPVLFSVYQSIREQKEKADQLEKFSQQLGKLDSSIPEQEQSIIDRLNQEG